MDSSPPRHKSGEESHPAGSRLLAEFIMRHRMGQSDIGIYIFTGSKVESLALAMLMHPTRRLPPWPSEGSCTSSESCPRRSL